MGLMLLLLAIGRCTMANAKVHVDKARILVLAPPDAPELEVLKSLPAKAVLVGVGKTLEDLEKREGCPY